MAKSVPHVIAAGRAGGIVIVTRFKDLSIMYAVPRSRSIIGLIEIQKPINAISPMMPTNLRESL